ncbi:hypothetical protein PT2222_190060 [Paraburkholderia tropica]
MRSVAASRRTSGGDVRLRATRRRGGVGARAGGPGPGARAAGDYAVRDCGHRHSFFNLSNRHARTLEHAQVRPVRARPGIT